MQSAAEILREAQDQYLADPPYEAPYSSMMDFTREGRALGKEAFALPEDEREHFIESAVEGENPIASEVVVAAAWDEVHRLSRNAPKMGVAA